MRAPIRPGSAGADGCPVDDPDGDGIVGDADQCPDQPEDNDGFQDADGCPDPDNDGDGIVDAQDACPNDPETVNGYQDDDGCPDEVPADITAALATAVRFEPGHARVTEAGRTALRTLFAMFGRHPEVRVVIIGHAERAGGEDLARRRADAVKWHLVDLGIVEDRIATRVGAVPGAPAITFQLAVTPAPSVTPPPAPSSPAPAVPPPAPPPPAPSSPPGSPPASVPPPPASPAPASPPPAR